MYFAAASVERNNNTENVRNEVPSSDHPNLSDAENSTYIFTEDEFVLTYSVDSEFAPFIKTQNHPIDICRPLSKVWGRFLVVSPEKDSANQSAFVNEDVEEHFYFSQGELTISVGRYQ